jgi:hypothetical protein
MKESDPISKMFWFKKLKMDSDSTVHIRADQSLSVVVKSDVHNKIRIFHTEFCPSVP